MVSLNLICYFFALFTTLTTAAVVRDVFDGYNNTATRLVVPDRMAVDWRSDDLRMSDDYYKNAAKEHFYGYYKIGGVIYKRSWQFNGIDTLHADHVFELQMAAKILHELDISKSFGGREAYMAVLNSKGNMRLVNHEVNGWKGTCVTSYLGDHGWICNNAGTTVRSYMLSDSIEQQMRTTALELDEILEPYVDLGDTFRHRNEVQNLIEVVENAFDFTTDPEPKESLAFRIQTSSTIEWLSQIFLVVRPVNMPADPHYELSHNIALRSVDGIYDTMDFL